MMMHVAMMTLPVSVMIRRDDLGKKFPRLPPSTVSGKVPTSAQGA